MGVTVNIIGPGPVDEIRSLEEAYAHCGCTLINIVYKRRYISKLK